LISRIFQKEPKLRRVTSALRLLIEVFMRTRLATLATLGLLVTATTMAAGCAPEDPQGSRWRRNNGGTSAPPTDSTNGSTKGEMQKTVSVAGRISSEGDGNVDQGLAGKNVLKVARNVEVFSLAQNGDLKQVGNADIQPGGAFNLTLNDKDAKDKDATGLFILKVKDAVGAVVGSGVVNGLPAFFKAFLVDATIDTVTSFKAEILVTLAKKGVPGVQNYLNVVNAYVDAQLANSIAVVGVLSTDLVTLIGTTSDAIIAAFNVIQEALNKAGIPIDLSALTDAQASAVSGIQNLINDNTGKLVTGSKAFIAALQAAAAKGAAPIDELIFNAVVNGGAKFGGEMKKNGKSEKVSFAASKSVFNLEAALTTGNIADLFKNIVRPDILDAINEACGDFLAQIKNAQSAPELEAAKAKLIGSLLGKNDAPPILKLLTNLLQELAMVAQKVEATLNPLANDLLNAKVSLNPNAIGDALAKLDQNAPDVAASLEKLVKDDEAKLLANAIIQAQKAIVP
jgi:hypothetical protein